MAGVAAAAVQPNELPRHGWWTEQLLRVTAGSASGAVAAVLTAPLDLVKTRLQVQRVPPGGGPMLYRGIVGTLRATVHRDGLRGPFLGLGSTLLGLVPNWAIYFTAYGSTRALLRDTETFREHPSVTSMVASICAGVATVTATNPLWVVKVRLQTQLSVSGAPYEGVAHAFSSLVRHEGFGALYKGLSASLLGVSHAAVQFPLYEHFKVKLAARRGEVLDEQHFHAADLVVASASSKVLASALTYPHEVLRSRLQHQRRTDHYRSLPHAFRSVWRHEGVRGFYGGFGTNLVRVVPSCAVTFTVYELTFAWLMRQKWSRE